MTYSLAADIGAIAPGETVAYQVGQGAVCEVTYTERQAYGDDGRPVRGDTVGEYVLRWPERPKRCKVIHVGPGPRAKGYHAEKIADELVSAVPLGMRHR